MVSQIEEEGREERRGEEEEEAQTDEVVDLGW